MHWVFPPAHESKGSQRVYKFLLKMEHHITQSLFSLKSITLSPGLSHNKLEQVESSAHRRELLRASQAFESYFLSYLMKVMRDTVPQGALTENRMGEMFYSFYDEEIGKRAAQAGGIGLSDYVLASVSWNEPSTHPSASDPNSMKS